MLSVSAGSISGLCAIIIVLLGPMVRTLLALAVVRPVVSVLRVPAVPKIKIFQCSQHPRNMNFAGSTCATCGGLSALDGGARPPHLVLSS